MVISEEKESYTDTSKIVIQSIDKSSARELIEKYHYSHKWTLCDIAYGIYYHTEDVSEFFDCKPVKLIGAVIYGGPVGRSAAESISPLIKINECTELTRLFIHDGYGRNIESYCISNTLSLLKKIGRAHV